MRLRKFKKRKFIPKPRKINPDDYDIAYDVDSNSFIIREKTIREKIESSAHSLLYNMRKPI